jgi:hypothetical protein
VTDEMRFARDLGTKLVFMHQGKVHEEGVAKKELDCHGARAPRNDGVRFPPSSPRHCERGAAIQCRAERLAARTQSPAKKELDCRGARAPRNDGVRFPPSSPRHCGVSFSPISSGNVAENRRTPAAPVTPNLDFLPRLH